MIGRVDFTQTAMLAVIRYVNDLAPSRFSSLTVVRLALDEVYIESTSRILNCWKAYVRTTHKDGLIFEVTFSGSADKLQIDVYHKIDIITSQDAEFFPGE